MTKFEDPHKGRAQFYEDAERFQVRIKSKASVFVTAFLIFWLCGWAFGEIMVLGILFSGNSGGASFFLLAWLGAWTVGGLFALTQVLWGIAGYELLSLSKNVLTIQRHIPFFRRTWTYDADHITKVEVLKSSASDGHMFGGQPNMHGLFSNPGQGTIKFVYGLRSPGFGLGLDQAEARAIVDKLSARLRSK